MDPEEREFERTRALNQKRRPIKASLLPLRPIYWELHQIMTVFGIAKLSTLKKWCHFRGVTPGVHGPDRLLVTNIAPDDARPHWVCDDAELLRYLRRKGLRLYPAYLGIPDSDPELLAAELDEDPTNEDDDNQHGDMQGD